MGSSDYSWMGAQRPVGCAKITGIDVDCEMYSEERVVSSLIVCVKRRVVTLSKDR